MARVTEIEVKAIMDKCTTATATVNTMIDAASELITVTFEGDSTMSDTQLKELERWLTAHMLASTFHRMADQTKVGDASVKYTGKYGMKLESTPYGQMVLTLDTSGKMAKLGKQVATIFGVPTKEYDI
jgi:hypothetical protein